MRLRVLQSLCLNVYTITISQYTIKESWRYIYRLCQYFKYDNLKIRKLYNCPIVLDDNLNGVKRGVKRIFPFGIFWESAAADGVFLSV